MKKLIATTLCFVLAAGILSGCRRNMEDAANDLTGGIDGAITQTTEPTTVSVPTTADTMPTTEDTTPTTENTTQTPEGGRPTDETTGSSARGRSGGSGSMGGYGGSGSGMGRG